MCYNRGSNAIGDQTRRHQADGRTQIELMTRRPALIGITPCQRDRLAVRAPLRDNVIERSFRISEVRRMSVSAEICNPQMREKLVVTAIELGKDDPLVHLGRWYPSCHAMTV